MGIKLNLGCAMDLKKGFVNVDLFHTNPNVKIADVAKLDFVKNGEADMVYAKDVLEHMPMPKAKQAIKEWSRVLKKGGTIFIQTTNIKRQLRALQQGVWDLDTFNYMLFGGKGYVDGKARYHDYHHSVFTDEWLIQQLKSVGISVIKVQFDEIDQALRNDPRCHNLNIYLHGVKK